MIRRPPSFGPALLLASACAASPIADPVHALRVGGVVRSGVASPLGATAVPLDRDGDGVAAALDCDDADPHVFPGAPELCDGRRDDCDDDAWTSDDGRASFLTVDGVASDRTAALAAGDPTTPVSLSLRDDGTLSLCAGTWYLALSLDASVTVQGVGGRDAVVVSGGGRWRTVQAATSITGDVVLRGLTLVDGRAPSGGGSAVIAFQGPSFTMQDVVVRGAHSGSAQQPDHGGGVVIGGVDRVRLIDTVFEDNVAGGGGGGLFLEDVHDVVLEGVALRGNRSEAGRGGGLWAFDADVVARDLVVEDNVAAGRYGYGGGVALYDSTLDVLGGHFTGNGAERTAGALLVDESTARLEGVAFDDNAAPGDGGAVDAWYFSDVTLDRCALTGNAAGQMGGGVHLSTASLTLVDTTFAANVSWDVAGDWWAQDFADPATTTCADPTGCR